MLLPDIFLANKFSDCFTKGPTCRDSKDKYSAWIICTAATGNFQSFIYNANFCYSISKKKNISKKLLSFPLECLFYSSSCYYDLNSCPCSVAFVGISQFVFSPT